MHVYFDENDGTVRATVSIGDDDHRFEVWPEGEQAVVEYQETQSWRGVIRVSEPDEDVFKALVTSDEMTRWMEREGLTGVRRARPVA